MTEQLCNSDVHIPRVNPVNEPLKEDTHLPTWPNGTLIILGDPNYKPPAPFHHTEGTVHQVEISPADKAAAVAKAAALKAAKVEADKAEAAANDKAIADNAVADKIATEKVAAAKAVADKAEANAAAEAKVIECVSDNI